MRYALCALLIFIPCARQELKPQKIPLISISCRISEMLNYIIWIKALIKSNERLLSLCGKSVGSGALCQNFDRIIEAIDPLSIGRENQESEEKATPHHRGAAFSIYQI